MMNKMGKEDIKKRMRIRRILEKYCPQGQHCNGCDEWCCNPEDPNTGVHTDVDKLLEDLWEEIKDWGEK